MDLNFRNRNPLNIRATNIDWVGKTGSNKGFEVFSNSEYGYRAAAKNLYKYNEKDNLKKEVLREAKSLSVLIGPEGDFSPSEIELIHGNPNVVPFTISRNILRSDTAVISAISLVNFINNFN